MRKKKIQVSSDYKIMVVDDEIGIIDSLSVVLKRSGYNTTGFINPLDAIDTLKKDHYDLLILDYLMNPLHGDKVVEIIRKFDNEIYILLLTGHKDLAPPLETIRALDIQGYCEKNDRFDQLLLLVESGIKSISQMRMIKRFRDGLSCILEATPRIYQLKPLDNILEEILNEIVNIVGSENAFILIDDVLKVKDDTNKSLFKGIGRFKSFSGNIISDIYPEIIEHIGYASLAKKVVRIDEGIILPLINEYSHSIGAIYVESSELDEAEHLLEIFASQAAISLNNAFLHSLVNTKNDELVKTYDQLKIRYVDTIEALRLAVDAKDIYTRGHSDRVAYYAIMIGKGLGLCDKELEMLRVTGIFHDVGKIGTADDILLKTDKLNKHEYEEIKKHPLIGAHILSAVSMFKEMAPLVKSHHERIDGKGYPEGLKGEEIPYLSRIVAVADAFDAMMSDRLYRKRLNLEEAMEQLKKGAGEQFDAVIVDKFLTILGSYEQLVSEAEVAYRCIRTDSSSNDQ